MCVSVSSVHIGDVTPISNVRYYIDAIRKLLDTFDGSCPLVVNTMGWVDGLGADLLAAVTGLCRPQHIIQISPSTDSAPPRLPSYRPFEFHHVAALYLGLVQGSLQYPMTGIQPDKRQASPGGSEPQGVPVHGSCGVLSSRSLSFRWSEQRRIFHHIIVCVTWPD